MQANISINCRGCSKDVLMSEVSLDEDEGVYLCDTCIDRKTRYDEPVSTVSSVKSKVLDQPTLIQYVCMDCNYSFSRKESRNVETCPYCAKSNLVVK